MGIDINISLEKFACLLHHSFEGVDIHNVDLHDFAYLDGETALTVSQLFHSDENPGLARNEVIKYITLTAQVFTKIVFYNLLPKSRGYSHARRSAPLLIYCLMKGIRFNISKPIIDFMLSEHLLIPNRNLSFGMLITRLLKLFKFDLSGEKTVAPSIDINSTLLKRMHVGERAPIPPPSSGSSSASVNPFAAFSEQL